MKICIFSDIHGNGPAFKAASVLIQKVRADVNIFLGDLCGYYFDQLEILPVLKTMPNLVALRGNHDQAFLDILNGNESLRKKYVKNYGSSMENLLVSDYTDLSEWLNSLPVSYSELNSRIACYHGSPDDYLKGYVYPNTPINDIPGKCKFLFLGHTHYKMDKRGNRCRIVNPGSLGQPRDRGRPSFAVVDLESDSVRFHEVIYDTADIMRDLTSRDETNPYLMDVLNRN